MGALDFRLAGEPDVDEVVVLVDSAYRGESSRLGWTTEADLLDGQRTDAGLVRDILGNPRAVLLLASVGSGASGASVASSAAIGSLVGCCHLEDVGRGVGYLGMFCVRPGVQGRGWGRAIVDHAERWMQDAWGVHRVEMTVIRQRTELIAWYGRLGYQPTGATKPFPYGDERYGLPRRPDLEFVVLARELPAPPA